MANKKRCRHSTSRFEPTLLRKKQSNKIGGMGILCVGGGTPLMNETTSFQQVALTLFSFTVLDYYVMAGNMFITQPQKTALATVRNSYQTGDDGFVCNRDLAVGGRGERHPLPI